MNLFYLDEDVNKCAEYHCDKHVVKMVTELGQLLSTAYRMLDGKKEMIGEKKIYYRLKENDDVIMKLTHVNHPTAIWVRESSDNYQLCRDIFYALSFEYKHRYGKEHGAFTRLQRAIHYIPENIDYDKGLTQIPLAMPDDCKIGDVVESYREYYRKYKNHIAVWSRRPIPHWYF